MKKHPSIFRACRITTQKFLYFAVFLAALLRGTYFAAPVNIFKTIILSFLFKHQMHLKYMFNVINVTNEIYTTGREQIFFGMQYDMFRVTKLKFLSCKIMKVAFELRYDIYFHLQIRNVIYIAFPSIEKYKRGSYNLNKLNLF